MATYNISTIEDLQAIKPDYPNPGDPGHLDDDCVLLNDIDASDTFEWNPDPLWLPPGEEKFLGFIAIGQSGAQFTGSFDGGGFTISNLYMRNGGPNSNTMMGMLGYVLLSVAREFKDLTMTGCVCEVPVYGSTYASIFAGIFSGIAGAIATATNLNISGVITGNITGSGGVCNSCGYADFYNCTAHVDLEEQTPSSRIGCFVGGVDRSNFTDCSAGGSITMYSESPSASFFIGGFAGTTGQVAAPLYNAFLRCSASVAITIEHYGAGAASGSWVIGGFIGYVNPTGIWGASFTQCTVVVAIVSVGDISGSIGGFAGTNGWGCRECYAAGTIESPTATKHSGTYQYIGGFCSSGQSFDCYSRVNIGALGIVMDACWVGGFLGNGTTAEYCYSTGFVPSMPHLTSGGVGGFVGDGRAAKQCFWDTDTSGTLIGFAGGTGALITGKTTAQMKTRATFTDAGWDFIDETLNGLNDYWYIPEFEQTQTLQSNLTIWLSRIGEYDNFEEGVDDDDSFSLTLPTTNEIRWIKGLESLIIGTSEGEWKVASNKLDTPLSPSAYSAKEQTTYGSAPIQAVSVNSSILFLDYVRRKIREITYNVSEEKYVAPDMTELAEHITKSGVIDMAHQKNPDSIVWCVRTDGTLISMVYDREQDVVAWSQHETDGDVQSVCVVPNPNADEDDVWISVVREGTVCIEKMMPRDFGDNKADAFFVDSGVTQTTGSALVTGLSHLVGKELVVHGDGEQLVEGKPGDFTVTASGYIRVPGGLSVVHAGLPFEYQLKPMRIVLGSATGTSYGSITRVSELVLSFLNTLGVTYGNKEDDLYAIDFTDPRWEDEEYVDGLFSGDVVVAMPGGFSVNNPILISGSGTYPFTLRAMIVRLDKTGR